MKATQILGKKSEENLEYYTVISILNLEKDLKWWILIKKLLII